MTAPSGEGVGQDPAVSVRALVKRYGAVEAVAGIDLDVASGEVFGFLGPNGAGKTTTISILCTLVRPTSGRARVGGYDVATERDEVRRNIGLVFQETTLDGYLSAEQNLRFHAELYGIQRGLIAERIGTVMDMVGLSSRRKSLVKTFSGGMKRRLEIARGLMHSPRVLFLDEPTIGLDPQTRSSIWAYLEQLRATEDITIFLTTHYMEEAEHCDRIAIMDAGRIVVTGTPLALKAAVGKDKVALVTTDDATAKASLAERFGIEASFGQGGLSFFVEGGERFLPRLFSELGVEISSVSVSRPTLDDVFMSYTGTTIRDADAAEPDRAWATMRQR